MTPHFARALFISIAVLTCASPVIARDAGHPDTMQKVRDGVERYYQANPALRDTPGWLAAHPPATCALPRYPRAFIRDELEGTTVLRYQIDARGQAHNAVIAKSSGWAVLDAAALEALALCTFAPGDIQAWHPVGYQFSYK